MNSSTTKNRNKLLAGAIALALAISGSQALAAGKGIQVEVPYDAHPINAKGVDAPFYLNSNGDGLVVSDQAGGVYSVSFGGAVKELASKSAVKHPAGVAVATPGFGSHAGEVFVLNSPDGKGPCEVDRVDKSGAVSKFADLPKSSGGEATDCRDLEFGPPGSGYANKLFAATSANSALYAIDGSGKATVFCALDQPLHFEVLTISFLPASDPKAANMMAVGLHPRMTGAARVGRIGIVTPDGKLKDDPYMVGFVRPAGFGYAPSNWGSYGGQFFIVDTGNWATENNGKADGVIYRVGKDGAKGYATGLVDPTCMKFIGSKMVLADPSAKGRAGAGLIEVITSML